MTFPYLESVAVFRVISYVFETYLDIRQHAALSRPSLPATLKGVVSEDKFQKSKAYSLSKSCLHFSKSFVSLVEDLAVLLLFLLPWAWELSGKLTVEGGFSPDNEIAHSTIFMAGWTIFMALLDLPFSLYSTFVIEAKHGFNKQTLLSFFKDLFLGLALTAVIGPFLLAALITIVQIGGPYLPLFLWLFFLLVSLLLLTLYPVVIAPLFNKFTPLPEGELRAKIEKLSLSLRFPLKKLFVIDGSKRSSHSNAYMYGFFNNKRIVLYDTLIAQCSEDEVVAVIAHELGHWELKHTVFNFVLSQILSFLNFGGYACIRNSPSLFLSFGFESQPIIIGFILFQQIITPLSHVLGFVMNLVSRRFEFQADAFAQKLGYSKELRGGLIHLQEENLSAMNTDEWYSAYHYSHPPLVERLSAIAALDAQQEKKKD